MITLLASLTGFIGSLIPELLKYFIDKNDKKHELEILKQQIKISSAGIDERMSEIKTIADISEIKALYATYNSGIKFIDALNGSVRPVLAYGFFVLYATIKIMQFLMLPEITSIVYIESLWSLEDQSIFAGIISFYFGNRALAKLKNKN